MSFISTDHVLSIRMLHGSDFLSLWPFMAYSSCIQPSSAFLIEDVSTLAWIERLGGWAVLTIVFFALLRKQEKADIARHNEIKELVQSFKGIEGAYVSSAEETRRAREVMGRSVEKILEGQQSILEALREHHRGGGPSKGERGGR